MRSQTSCHNAMTLREPGKVLSMSLLNLKQKAKKGRSPGKEALLLNVINNNWKSTTLVFKLADAQVSCPSILIQYRIMILLLQATLLWWSLDTSNTHVRKFCVCTPKKKWNKVWEVHHCFLQASDSSRTSLKIIKSRDY